ncbi:MAG: deoxyuridine 5'-triphosphate nucleotidohydrolase Dut, dUTP pyrophosphatase [candidate division Kazan bacterium GW2011_GWA1_50_15]|uniref:dUTP diphosphatase n=2 Tax=Bacteria division Kazan-3B-28 TaxID=1798534 RepID=A0A0G1X7F9_UNCK3|nr:MAG: deoxyuridine 5'-triphosphate nucleotidohydrolase Dut, dUTP pyrophosphatase [candidate division Kazan bacterium GW2011_GWA1_50_15]KKW25636.1 MAG: Deoxyuridine 5'-triphosphate nucleotidohydrolase Dut [candidate division Kazan bacterium GW2011_GWC1_52_13]KKW26941.1 MAG: Deoxyuridine 5'-triphosphate nucleotidohydrolase Dut [candidate division Kazan bacterium GW2011_GWB1_52_7]HAV66070.1 dUTP diphosphatase [Patescibacteria group bacterium]HCR42607.1 dUTP diphosphatase [Patescibacteria group b
MRVRITRIDKTLPLPIYKTAGAAGFDLITREDTVIRPGEITRIPCNMIVQTPPGYMLLLTMRSSTPSKKPGLIKPHSVGIVDSDYCGPEDELKFQVQNVGDQNITVERGEAIGQGIFVKIEQVQLLEVEQTAAVSRGGFGSTG